VRAAVTLVIVAGLVASLSACSGAPEVVNADCVPAISGAVSDSVKVSGKLGTEPTVTIPSPLESIKTTQRTVSIPGKGDVAKANDDVLLDFTLYDGTTGAKLTSTKYDGADPASFTMNESLYLAGLIKTVQCSTVGSRIVGVIPPSEAFGDAGSSDLNVAPTDSIVFVADVISVTPALVAEKFADAKGLPGVAFSDSGVPTITIPDSDPPKDLRVAVITKGDGAVVDPAATVTVNYQGMDWETKTVFDDSWAKGAPATFSLTGVVPGFGKAIAGRTIGSTIIASIPAALGYGPSGGKPEAGIGATDTIVFVITIISVQ
jgi:peptidylprolyl isomerase